MFSTTPSTGARVFSNIDTPRRTSIRATSCGVETMTAPDRATRWARVSWMSPVPGGMSITSTSIGSSALAQATSLSIWLTAPEAMGPRQIMASVSSTSRPMDMIFRPKAFSGSILPSGRLAGLSVRPVIRGMEGP